jgi:hypothetical protein
MTTRTYKKYLPFIAIVALGVASACSAKNDADEPAASGTEDTRFGPIPPNSWLINPPNQPAR